MRRTTLTGCAAVVAASVALGGAPAVAQTPQSQAPRSAPVVVPADSATPAIVAAARDGDLAAVRALIAQRVDVNQAAGDGARALHWGVHRSSEPLVTVLLQAGADANATNKYGVAPLSLAAENGNAAIVAALLRAGADANAAMADGETVLMTAARSGQVSVLEALVEAGADINVTLQPTGYTPLMLAASSGNTDAVKALLAAGANLNARTGHAPPPPPVDTAATAASALVTNFGGGRSLFSADTPTGFTPFLFAVRAGHIDTVKALLDAGADVNDKLSDETTAIIVAAANAHWELADLLLDRGANPSLDGPGWNALHQAVRTRRPNIGFGTPGPIPTGNVDSIDVIRKMLSKGVDVNARMSRNGMKDGQRNRLNRLGATAFFLAAKITDVEVMKVLIEAGADANIPNADGTTPLMVAAGLHIWNPGEDGGSLPGQEDEVLEAVKMCVELGNDVNAVNDMGETALMGSAFRGVNQVAEYLAAQGAKLDARDSRGWSALGIAMGLTYSDFFKQQVHTADLLRKLMQAQGLPTEGHAIDPKVCFDCLQTRGDQQRAVMERDRRMEAEWAERERSSQQQQQ